jgi:regulator of protease activity HflC (stomatin/prohibitin superfamily)
MNREMMKERNILILVFSAPHVAVACLNSRALMLYLGISLPGRCKIMIEWIIIGIIVFIGLLWFVSGLRVVQQWEEGLVFMLGRYRGKRPAGLTWIIPGISQLAKIDTRIRTMDVKPQEVITKDSATVAVDAVVYFKVFDVMKAKLNVKDFEYAATLLAQSALRDVVGKGTLDDLLANKKELGIAILNSIQGPTDDWGVNITAVEIKNVEVPPNMKRAMAKEAEAIREKRARLIKAEAEVDASKKFAEAADIISRNPTALKLRELQTWQEIGAEQNSLMILIPSGLEGFGGTIAAATGVNLMKDQQTSKKETRTVPKDE